jgi:hypothetical protein
VPQAEEGVGGLVGRADPRGLIRVREGEPRAELGELSRSDPAGAIEQQDIAPPKRTQCVKRARDLRLDIEDTGEALGKPVSEVDR